MDKTKNVSKMPWYEEVIRSPIDSYGHALAIGDIVSFKDGIYTITAFNFYSNGSYTISFNETELIGNERSVELIGW